jgi:hypothetical protein
MKKLFSNSIMYFLPVEDTDLVSKRKLIGDTPHKAGVNITNQPRLRRAPLAKIKTVKFFLYFSLDGKVPKDQGW